MSTMFLRPLTTSSGILGSSVKAVARETRTRANVVLEEASDVLFLLLNLVLSELSHPEAKPLDFVCVNDVRKVMNKVKDLQEDLAHCGTAALLPVPVRTPYIRVNFQTWQSKPIPVRRAEILQSLRMLAQDIHHARNQSQDQCAVRLLDRLEHNINNYIHTLTQIHTQSGPDGLKVQAPSFHHFTNLSLVLQHFDRLISRKLEWLVNEMARECETETDR
ncbi:thrombopoietin isoform X2 [Hemibagrus wyckioides]|uniref:thrombopoietin isoform X2 n=1 Tax=Hemibagrus wyckioides TaxID=337641 RepID=UPI00266D114F|nr:thrombopoietin isoform X2 [Hemibagrus wyckioides]